MAETQQRRYDPDSAVEGWEQYGRTRYTKRVGITAPSDGSEQDTGFDLPSGAIVRDVFLDVGTAESTGTTKTIDVGLLSSESGGDADGFLDGISVASTGIVYPTLDSGGQTLGALLSADEDGAGALVPESFNADSVTAASVSFTAASANFAELVADIVIVYDVVD